MLKLYRCNYHDVIVNARRAAWRHASCDVPSSGMSWQNVVLQADEIAVLIPASFDSLDPSALGLFDSMSTAMFGTPYRASAGLGWDANG